MTKAANALFGFSHNKHSSRAVDVEVRAACEAMLARFEQHECATTCDHTDCAVIRQARAAIKKSEPCHHLDAITGTTWLKQCEKCGALMGGK